MDRPNEVQQWVSKLDVILLLFLEEWFLGLNQLFLRDGFFDVVWDICNGVRRLHHLSWVSSFSTSDKKVACVRSLLRSDVHIGWSRGTLWVTLFTINHRNNRESRRYLFRFSNYCYRKSYTFGHENAHCWVRYTKVGLDAFFNQSFTGSEWHSQSFSFGKNQIQPLSRLFSYESLEAISSLWTVSVIHSHGKWKIEVSLEMVLVKVEIYQKIGQTWFQRREILSIVQSCLTDCYQ